MTSGGSSASSSRGPSRSAITTSASASSCLPLTVMRPGSPGPPPTRATPASLLRWWRAAIVPDRSPAVIASRIAALCRGSPLSTPTLVSPAVPEAGVQAVAAAASSARTHHVRFGLGLRRHRGVDLRPAGAGDDQPGAGAVPGGVAAAAPVDPAVRGQLLEGRGDRRRDEQHVRAGREQPRHPAGGYRSRRRPRAPACRAAAGRAGTPRRIRPAVLRLVLPLVLPLVRSRRQVTSAARLASPRPGRVARLCIAGDHFS